MKWLFSVKWNPNLAPCVAGEINSPWTCINKVFRMRVMGLLSVKVSI